MANLKELLDIADLNEIEMPYIFKKIAEDI